MRQLLAFTIGLCLVAGCKPPASTAPTSSSSATSGSLNSTEQTAASQLAQETAEIGQMGSDLNQGESKADSSLGTAATASVTFSLEGVPSTVDNGDGTRTNTLGLKASAGNGVVRTLTVATTRYKTLAGLLSGMKSREMTLTVTLPTGGSRKATRTVEVNGDGSRTVTNSFTVTTAAGKTRTAAFTRTGSDGAYTVNGTLTRADGAKVSFTYEVAVSGDVQVTATENGVTVTSTINASGSLTSATATSAGGTSTDLTALVEG